METMGGAMSGYSRTGSCWKDKRPRITSSRLITMANTGRRTDKSEMTIAIVPQVPSGCASMPAAASLMGVPSRTFWVPSTMTRSPGTRPSITSTQPG